MRSGDGGPAFPVEMSIGEEGMSELQTGNRSFMTTGMSLRDYFAAAALTGLLAEGGANVWENDADNAYKAADAMMKAREEAPK